MSPISNADAMMLEQIRTGDRDGWALFVDRFQGRLTAFAKGQLGQVADAEDVVQETFIGFLKIMPRFREEASIETVLFQILRRRIVDVFRSRGRQRTVSLVQAARGADREPIGEAQLLASNDMTASAYARRDEQDAEDLRGLISAVGRLVEQFKSSRKWRELKVFDLLFFGRWKNQRIAESLDEDETTIGVMKHRFLKRVAAVVASADGTTEDEQSVEPASADLLERLWEDARPTCVKRSTLGKFLLGTLDEDWDEFVDFHLNTLGCHFCEANLVDLEEQTNSGDPNQRTELQGRIMESTVGFFEL